MTKTRTSFVLALIFTTISSVAVAGSFDNYCTAPNTFSISATSTTFPTFDYLSHYLNSDKESSPLLVTKGDGTNAFKWRTYDKEGALTTERECTGSEDDEFVALVGSYLFLKAPTGAEPYSVCMFNPAANSAKRLIETGATTYDSFRPYSYVDGGPIFVMGTVGNSASLLIFIWDSIGSKYYLDQSIKSNFFYYLSP